MDAAMYSHMAEQEGSHWWFRGRRAVVLDMLARRMPRSGRLLDIGLGTGYNARLLTDEGYTVEGVEPASEAIAVARKLVPDIHIYETPFPSPEIPSDAYRVAVMFDVLEHLPNDVEALKGVKRVLEHDGMVLITVPAFPFLWTQHDVRAHHFRRYRKHELVRAITAAGLEPVYVSYYNFFLFPLIALVRFVQPYLRMEDTDDLEKSPRFLNTPLSWLFGGERFLLRLLVLPYGVSLVAIARKP